MDFETETQKACYERVSPWLRELFGNFAAFRSDAPVVGVKIGSILAQVGFSPWSEDDVTITTRAYVAEGIPLTPDLMHFLLRENDKMRFGAFGVDEDDNIFYEHTIVGSSCDKGELKGSVMAVVLSAGQYEEQIRETWGGEPAVKPLR